MAEHYPFMLYYWIFSWTGQTVFLPYWRICIRSRRSHPDTPMDPFHPSLFPPNIIHFLWIEINVYHLILYPPCPHGPSTVWFNPKPACSAAVSDTWTTIRPQRPAALPNHLFLKYWKIECNYHSLRWKKHLCFKSERKPTFCKPYNFICCCAYKKIGQFFICAQKRNKIFRKLSEIRYNTYKPSETVPIEKLIVAKLFKNLLAMSGI
jgi:hypothetical protein